MKHSDISHTVRRYFGRLLTAGLLAATATAPGAAKVPTAYMTPEKRAEVNAKEFPEFARADRLMQDSKVIFVNSGSGVQVSNDTAVITISRFYYNQFRHAQDPLAPYFMFMSKDARMAMGIGGMIKMRGWFDWNGTVPSNNFSPSAIEIPKNPATPRRMGCTPASTGFFFTLLGHNTPIGSYMGYFEASFDGADKIEFKLQKAYFTLNDWTVGYATSTFSDPSAQVPTIDGAGPNGKVDRTNILVRYLKSFGRDRWSVGGSLEFPSSGIRDDGKNTEKGTDWLPDLAALGQYQWDSGLSHVRLSGLLRFLPYRDLLTQTNHTLVGWGLQLSAHIKVLPSVMVYGTTHIGQGHSSYTGDLGGGKIDLISNPASPGHLYTPTMFGFTTGVKYDFLPKFSATVGMARLGFHATKGGELPDNYRYGLYGIANVFWHISPRVESGIEYLIGERKNFSGAHASANRIEALFQLSF